MVALEDGGYLIGAEAEQVSNTQYHALLIKLEEDLTACGSLVEVALPPLVLTQGVAA